MIMIQTKTHVAFLVAILLAIIALGPVGCDHAGTSVDCGTARKPAPDGSGTCVYKSCTVGSDECGQNYRCSGSGVCEPRKTCVGDAECGSGACIEGVCHNPDICTFDEHCIPGDLCRNNICIESPCGPNKCKRGVCQADKNQERYGECISAEKCEPETEGVLCEKGSRCIENKCVSGEEYCSNPNACAEFGGVCSKKKVACVDKDLCDGENSNCLKGKYCSETGFCETSRCNEGNTACTDGRGVCDPSSGDCINAKVCTSDEQCKATHTCISSDGSGTCVESSDKCQGMCKGNATCIQDGEVNGLPAFKCREPDTCKFKMECNGTNICRGGKCVESSGTCSPDRYDTGTQPNNTIDSALDFSTEATNHKITGLVLCGVGEDWFKVGTDILEGIDKSILIRIEIEPEDVGSGTVVVNLRDGQGNVVKTVRSDANGEFSSQVFLAYEIPKPYGSKYYIEVTGDETSMLHVLGVRYALEVRLSDSEIVRSCTNTREVLYNVPLTGNTSNSSGFGLQDCLDREGVLQEEVWHMKVDRLALITATVVTTNTDTDFDAVLGIRKDCTLDQSQIQCASENGVGEIEEIQRIFQPGDYYLTVSSKGRVDIDTEYTLTVHKEDLVCEPGEGSRCDGNYSYQCNELGTRKDKEVYCVNQCDTSSFLCLSQKGDFCTFAHEITSPDTSLSKEIIIDNYQNNYEPGLLCPGLDLKGRRTAQEAVFSVTVPNGKGVHASIVQNSASDRYDDHDRVIYLFTDCHTPLDSCEMGVNNSQYSGREDLFWRNTSGHDLTVFIAFDQIADDLNRFGVDISDVNIEIVDMSCTPGTVVCNSPGTLSSSLEKCAENGSGFGPYVDCPTGCSAGSDPKCNAPVGDLCSNPIEISNGESITGIEVWRATNSIKRPECDSGTINPAGDEGNKEYVFKVSASKGQIVKFFVNPDYNMNPMVWLGDSCGASNEMPNCKMGVNDSYEDGVPETLIFKAYKEGNSDYYIVVEDASEGTFGVDGSFEVALEISDIDSRCNKIGKLTCLKGGDAIEYCDSDGVVNLHHCTCTADEEYCTTRTGDSCFDAMELPPSPFHGSFDASNGHTNSFSSIGLENGCFGDSVNSYEGNDSVYVISLDDQQLLSLEFEVVGDDIESNETRAYLLKDCFDKDTCFASAHNGSQHILYRNDSGKTETLFLVIDSLTPNNSSTWTVNWSITEARCVENKYMCKDNGLITCDASGSSTVSCANLVDGSTVCDNGFCKVEPSSANSCGDAKVIQSGARIVWDPNTATNSSVVECASSDGPDSFYKIYANVGQRIVVKGRSTAGESISAYIFADCDLPSQTCLESAKSDSGEWFTIDYKVEEASNYFIAIDTQTAGAKAQVVATVNLVDNECNGTESATCEGNYIEYCSSGKLKQVSCACSTAGGVPSCDLKDGDTCMSAIPLTGDKGSFDLQDFSNNSNYGDLTSIIKSGDNDAYVSGACVFGKKPNGPNRYYSIELKEGDHLHVELNQGGSRYNLLLYLVDSCYSQECLTSDPIAEGWSARSLDYVAREDGTYYIVAGSFIEETPGNEKFNIAWEVTKPADQVTLCVPNTSWCKNSTTVVVCSSDGSYSSEGMCPHGCQNGVCKYTLAQLRAFDQCSSSLPEISQSQVIQLPSNLFTSQYNKKFNHCPGFNDEEAFSRQDAFFKVKLKKAGMKATVSVLSHSVYDEVAIARFDSCSSLTQCKDGKYLGESSVSAHKSVIEYVAEQDDDEFVFIVDEREAFSADKAVAGRQIVVEITETECDPNKPAEKLRCTDGDKLAFCSADRRIRQHICDCSTFGGIDACTNPTLDTCEEAKAVEFTTGNSVTESGSFYQLTNTLELASHNSSALNTATPGRDAVYVVEIPPGKQLDVRAVSNITNDDDKEDLAVYILGSCNHIVNNLLAGSDAHSYVGGDNHVEEVVTYRNPSSSESKLVYVVVDSFWRALRGGYDVTFELRSP